MKEIDELIKEKLNKTDARFLLTGIRTYSSLSFFSRDIDSTYQKAVDHLTEMVQYESQDSSAIHKHLHECRSRVRIHELYQSLGYTAKEYLEHWTSEFEDQIKIRSELNSMAPNPKQDNKGYYVGSGNRHGKSTRLPRKKRKTAWKRFYKMFPSIDPENKSK